MATGGPLIGEPLDKGSLTDFEQILLGLLARNPRSGCELKRFFADTERYIEATPLPGRHAHLAMRHGLDVHNASLAWVYSAIDSLTADPHTHDSVHPAPSCAVEPPAVEGS
ncbi:MAG: hypothetical protein M0Z30_17380 [Actinomycetota bacterium]|nr:hypothetical protein [Actinomycetota bacterium]